MKPRAIEALSFLMVLLSFENCKNTVEDFYKPAECAAVNLPAVFAVVAAGHLLAAAVTVTVIVGVGMTEFRDWFAVCMC